MFDLNLINLAAYMALLNAAETKLIPQSRDGNLH